MGPERNSAPPEGEALMIEEEILDRIDIWHKMPTKVWQQMGEPELHEYLGWSWEQYAAYVDRGEIPSNDQDRPEGRS